MDLPNSLADRCESIPRWDKVRLFASTCRAITATVSTTAPRSNTTVQRAEQLATVLIVDDEPTVRMLRIEILDDLGYAWIEAEDSATGLKILQSDARIDLLISDVGLPGRMNGRQMADAGCVARPGLPVLFITGYAEMPFLTMDIWNQVWRYSRSRSRSRQSLSEFVRWSWKVVYLQKIRIFRSVTSIGWLPLHCVRLLRVGSGLSRPPLDFRPGKLPWWTKGAASAESKHLK
jgi:CheY-like chemotaxis protein